jgi:hypothetical protein
MRYAPSQTGQAIHGIQELLGYQEVRTMTI